MPIQMKCPSCGKALRIRDESADKKGKCPACGGVFAIPSHSDLPTLEELPRETGQTAAQRKKAPLQKIIVFSGVGLVIAAIAIAVILHLLMAHSAPGPKATTKPGPAGPSTPTEEGPPDNSMKPTNPDKFGPPPPATRVEETAAGDSTEDSYPIAIGWAREVPAPIALSDAPEITYRKTKGSTLEQVLVKVRASYKVSPDETAAEVVTVFVPHETPGDSGTIKGGWAVLAGLGLTHLSKLGGTGTIEVALFEVIEKRPDKFSPGKQLSPWIGLPVDLSAMKGLFRLF